MTWQEIGTAKSLGIEVIIIFQTSKLVCGRALWSDGKQMQMAGLPATAALLAPQSWKEAHFKCVILYRVKHC